MAIPSIAESWIYKTMEIAKQEVASRSLLLANSDLTFDKNEQLYINKAGKKMSCEMARFCPSQILLDFMREK